MESDRWKKLALSVSTPAPAPTPMIIDTDKFYPDKVYAEAVCLIGCGRHCCRYLAMKPDGLSCEKRTSFGRVIDLKVDNGQMTARGDNCRGLYAR
jgi:hypothetical protein